MNRFILISLLLLSLLQAAYSEDYITDWNAYHWQQMCLADKFKFVQGYMTGLYIATLIAIDYADANEEIMLRVPPNITVEEITKRVDEYYLYIVNGKVPIWEVIGIVGRQEYAPSNFDNEEKSYDKNKIG